MSDALINALVPIFAVMGLGYLAGRVRDVDNANVSSLNALVMDFALPASLFAATASAARPTLLAQWPAIVAMTVSMLTIYALAYLMQRRLFGLGAGEASVVANTIGVPNYAGAGLPLLVTVFGDSSRIDSALGIACATIVISPLTLVVLEARHTHAGTRGGSGATLRAIGRALGKPIVLGPMLGMAFCLLGIPLAGSIRSSLHLIGQGAGGVALFLTGLILSAQPVNLGASVISGAILKNVLHPLLALALVLMLPIERETAREVVILCALPCGFFGVLFGLRYEVQSRAAGSLLIVSTLASAVTLTLALALIGRM